MTFSIKRIVDDLGRIVIPKPMRTHYGLDFPPHGGGLSATARNIVRTKFCVSCPHRTSHCKSF